MIPRTHDDSSARDSSTSRENELSIRWLGHSTIKMNYKNETIITDPIFRRRLFHLRRSHIRPCVDYGQSQNRQVVLISHLHHDHLDIQALRRMASEVLVIVPPGARKFLHGKVPQSILEIGVGDSYIMDHSQIMAVEAAHGGRRWPGIAADSQGYMIDVGRTVYFAGDTKLFPGMVSLGAEHDVELALLPVWGHSPRLGKNHLNPVQAARALSMVGARYAIPIHWGTYSPLGLSKHLFLHKPPRDFASHAAIIAPHARIRILRPCEEFVLNGLPAAA